MYVLGTHMSTHRHGVICFETGSHYVSFAELNITVQAGLEFKEIYLSLPPERRSKNVHHHKQFDKVIYLKKKLLI